MFIHYYFIYIFKAEYIGCCVAQRLICSCTFVGDRDVSIQINMEVLVLALLWV